MKKAIFILAIASLCCCSEEKRSDELLLWEYYKGFTYPPQLFDSLSRLANEPITKQFFSGLKCFEKYSQDEKVDCYDSAFDIFSDLQRKFPDNYLGHLGMGLLITEKGMVEGVDSLFEAALAHYEQAQSVFKKKFKDGHPAVYYYHGRNDYNRNKNMVNENAIKYLDTATILKPDFFKAFERSGRFLSHYMDLAFVSASKNPLVEAGGGNDLAQKFNAAFPQAKERVRYLFRRSMEIDPSWFETYQDISIAHHAYSAKERLDFLETGIAIAQKKKSRDSLRLIKSLANLYFFDLSDYEKARQHYSHWISEHGNAADYINLAWCQYFLGQREAVPFLMSQAVKKDNTSMSHFQYALYYKEESQLNQALAELDMALAMETKSPPEQVILAERAKLLNMQGRKKEAADILNAIAQSGKKGEVVQKAQALREVVR
jgi:tetratricopeptide (TPR) repeat protein